MTLYYIMEEYSIDFVELTLECITKVYNLSRKFSLPYSNSLTHIFETFQIPIAAEDCLDTQVPTINEHPQKRQI